MTGSQATELVAEPAGRDARGDAGGPLICIKGGYRAP